MIYNNTYRYTIYDLYDLVHLWRCDNTVTVQVKNSENLSHHFLWRSLVHDVEDEHKLSEVNIATAICVVDSGKFWKFCLYIYIIVDISMNLNTCFSIFEASFFGRAFCIIWRKSFGINLPFGWSAMKEAKVLVTWTSLSPLVLESATMSSSLSTGFPPLLPIVRVVTHWDD